MDKCASFDCGAVMVGSRTNHHDKLLHIVAGLSVFMLAVVFTPPLRTLSAAGGAAGFFCTFF